MNISPPACRLSLFCCVIGLTLFALNDLFAAELPAARIPDACGMQLKTHNFTTEVIDQVHELGFRVIRRRFY